MADSDAAELKIPNFSYAAFWHVLRHMYGMPLTVESDLYVDVLRIADYYHLSGLRSEVELFLLPHVDAECACDLWHLAYEQDLA